MQIRNGKVVSTALRHIQNEADSLGNLSRSLRMMEFDEEIYTMLADNIIE